MEEKLPRELPPLKTFVTPPEAARALRVRTEKIHRWIRSGRLPAINTSEGTLRPRWKIDVRDFDRLLEEEKEKTRPRSQAKPRRTRPQLTYSLAHFFPERYSQP